MAENKNVNFAGTYCLITNEKLKLDGAPVVVTMFEASAPPAPTAQGKFSSIRGSSLPCRRLCQLDDI